MILRYKGDPYVIPEGWHEVTWARYVLALPESDEMGIASALTGLPIAVVFEMRDLIIPRLSFWGDPIPPLCDPEPIDIGQRSWEDMNNANAAFSANASNHYGAAIDVVRIYYGFDITDELVGYAMPYVLHLFEQFAAFGERFEDLGKDVPDDNMVAAGIDKLHAFGWFPTLDALAKGNILDYDLILQQPAITVYSKLLLDMVTRNYTDELNRINAFSSKHGLPADN